MLSSIYAIIHVSISLRRCQRLHHLLSLIIHKAGRWWWWRLTCCSSGLNLSKQQCAFIVWSLGFLLAPVWIWVRVTWWSHTGFDVMLWQVSHQAMQWASYWNRGMLSLSLRQHQRYPSSLCVPIITRACLTFLHLSVYPAFAFSYLSLQVSSYFLILSNLLNQFSNFCSQ